MFRVGAKVFASGKLFLRSVHQEILPVRHNFAAIRPYIYKYIRNFRYFRKICNYA